MYIHIFLIFLKNLIFLISMPKGQQRVFVLSIIVLSKLDWVVAVT